MKVPNRSKQCTLILRVKVTNSSELVVGPKPNARERYAPILIGCNRPRFGPKLGFRLNNSTQHMMDDECCEV